VVLLVWLLISPHSIYSIILYSDKQKVRTFKSLYYIDNTNY